MLPLERQSILNSEISAADSRVGIFAALRRVAHEFSLAHVTLFQVPRQHDELATPLIVETTLKSEYLREFDRHRLLRESPILTLVTASSLPVCWSVNDPETANGVRFPQKLIELQKRFDIPTHVSMRQNSIDGDSFLLHFSGSRPVLRQVELNELGMLSLHAFDIFDRIRRNNKPASTGKLTVRELEVVRWTAQGKTSVEIARILSLSDHTVNAYLTNAIKKLDCVNRTQLVAKAIRLKLIV